MKRRGPILLFVLALAACARPSPSDLVLARVNGDAITVERLEDSFTSSHRGHSALLAGRGAVREFLDSAIDRELLIQEGRRIGFEDQPDIRAARAELRAKRAAEGFYEDAVTKKVAVTDEEVAAAYAKLGERIEARHILVERREDAGRALARVRAGEEFGEVARQVSRSDSAGRGGDLGIVEWGRLDPKLEAALWPLKKGEVSEPFETEEGWNLLYVVDRRTVELPKLDEVKPRVRARLVQRKTREQSAELFSRLVKQSGSMIDEAPVLAALAEEGSQRPAPETVVADAGGERITLERALGLVNREAARLLPPDQLRRQVRWLLEAEVFKILLRKEGLDRGYGDRAGVARELDKLTDEAVLQQLLQKVVLANVEVGDADIDAYYRSHAEEFTEPEAVKISAILVEKEEEANEAVSAVEAGKDFGTLARTLSKDPSLVATGGDIAGWVVKGKLDPAVEAVAFSLKNEGALGVAKGSAGYFVVRLDKRREAHLRPLSEVREQAKEAALSQRSRDTVKSWVAKLRDASTIEVDDAAVDRAIASYEAMARERAKRH